MVEINKSLEDDKRWALMPVGKSVFHMFRTNFKFDGSSPNGEKNLKFVSYDGIYEAVYNENEILLTEKNDPWNMGTYNYVDPDLALGIYHYGQDVLPYEFLGTGFGNDKDAGLPPTSAFKNEDIYENNPYNLNPSPKKYREDFIKRWTGKVL